MSAPGRTLDRDPPEGRPMRYVTDRQAASLWTTYGLWADHGEAARARSREILAPLEPYLLYPDGGREALWLPGWDNQSVWGFDPPNDAYFAQLWRNAAAHGSDPDIWILGRGTLDGRPFAVTTARILAQEVAAATGAELDAVCKAMLGIDPGS